MKDIAILSTTMNQRIEKNGENDEGVKMVNVMKLFYIFIKPRRKLRVQSCDASAEADRQIRPTKAVL